MTKRAKTKEEGREKTGVARSFATKEGKGEGERRRELHRDYRMQYDSHLDSAPHGICMTC